MSKKKRRSVPKIVKATPRQLVAGLSEANALMRRKRWGAAREILEDLDRRYSKTSS